MTCMEASGVARGGGGGWPPGASLGGGAGPAIVIGANFKNEGPALPIWGCFFFFFLLFFFGLSIFPPGGGGGSPMQALTPGRWRPSLRH